MKSSPFRSARLLLVALGLAAASGGSAQSAPTVAPDHVTFYTEPNFKGESLAVEAGASVENLERMMRASQQPWTAAISSIQVSGAARATVYSAAGFSGDRLEITRSIPDLYAEPRARDNSATWDRSIASIAVTGPQPTVMPQPGPATPPPPSQPPQTIPGRNDPPPTVVIVQPPRPPPTTIIIQEPPRPRLDRRTADQIVNRAFRDVLDRPADPEGLATYRNRLMYEGWSERQMIESLQRSGEARAIKPDAAIKKIYREVLGRDPDPNGLAHYRAKWRDGWTQGQIRDDLRKSHEGSNTYVRDAITRAYREVLGRDPDPAGYATYEKAMRERGYTERDVRRALMSGDEYRQRQRR